MANSPVFVTWRISDSRRKADWRGVRTQFHHAFNWEGETNEELLQIAKALLSGQDTIGSIPW